MTAKTLITRSLSGLSVALVFLATGCASEPEVEPGADWGYVYAVIESNCSCHLSEEGESGLSMMTMDAAYANLVGTASQELPALNRIEAGDPDNSYLVRKITGTHQDGIEGSGARMPFG